MLCVKSIPGPQLIVATKPYSNQIFNYHRRGMSALDISYSPPKHKFNTRQHNILLLRRSKKQSHFKQHGFDRKAHSVQFMQHSPNKVNFINLSSFSIVKDPRIKSNYCKKMTLTNVDKYYEFCLKKVKSFNANDVKQCPEQKQQSNRMKSRPDTPARRQNTKQAHNQTPEAKKLIIYNNSPNTFSKSVNLRKKQQDMIVEPCNFSKILFSQQKSNLLQHRMHFKQQLPAREIKSSNCNRSSMQLAQSRSDRNSLMTRQRLRADSITINGNADSKHNRYQGNNKINQFVLDGWQDNQQAPDDVF